MPLDGLPRIGGTRGNKSTTRFRTQKKTASSENPPTGRSAQRPTRCVESGSWGVRASGRGCRRRGFPKLGLGQGSQIIPANSLQGIVCDRVARHQNDGNRFYHLVLVLAKHLPQQATGAGANHCRTHFSTGHNAQAQLFGGQPVQDESAANFAAPLFLETSKVGGPADPAPTGELEPQRRIHCGREWTHHSRRLTLESNAGGPRDGGC